MAIKEQQQQRGKGRAVDFSLTEIQAAFALSRAKYPAMVSGFGAGKTTSMVLRVLMQKIMFPKGKIGWYAPTYDLISKIALPKIQEALEAHGLKYRQNKQEKTITVEGYGGFILRTMDNPELIVGYEHCDAAIDELDILQRDKAEAAWIKILARNRQMKPNGGLNTIAVATTPEGFRFTYEMWQKNVKKDPDFVLYKATTHSNLHNLPVDYISNLAKQYSPALLAAYVNGDFVNLKSGTIYPDFNRKLNRTNAVPERGESLHIGIDFNVYNVAAVVGVVRDKKLYVVGEFSKMRDTPALIEAIKTRYSTPGLIINVYPDASGAHGNSTNASVSDILLLRAAGFQVRARSKNPDVVDRIAAVNGMILNGTGERRFFVNEALAPDLCNTLEQQTYLENGTPDKRANIDHKNDALGYLFYTLWPIGTGRQIITTTGI